MRGEIDRKNREYLKRQNETFKQECLKLLKDTKEYIVSELLDNVERINELNPYQKLINIYPCIFYLSFYTDEESMSLLESLGVSPLVTKYFMPCTDFFKALDKLQEASEYLLLYEGIWMFYKHFSDNFFKKQLAVDLGIDLKRVMEKISRQEREERLPEILTNLHDELKRLRTVLKTSMPEIMFPVYDKGLSKSLKKALNFSHKIDYHNLYMGLADFNRRAISEKMINIDTFHEPDFKCEFFDLLKLLLRDKSILNDGVDAQLNYGKPGNRRLKIKRVERLILP